MTLFGKENPTAPISPETSQVPELNEFSFSAKVAQVKYAIKSVLSFSGDSATLESAKDAREVIAKEFDFSKGYAYLSAEVRCNKLGNGWTSVSVEEKRELAYQEARYMIAVEAEPAYKHFPPPEATDKEFLRMRTEAYNQLLQNPYRTFSSFNN